MRLQTLHQPCLAQCGQRVLLRAGEEQSLPRHITVTSDINSHIDHLIIIIIVIIVWLLKCRSVIVSNDDEKTDASIQRLLRLVTIAML